ncbi:MAG: hypothetical protein ACT4OM_09740 [Actinomycetota bacterium]
MSRSQEEMIRENAGDAMNRNTQSPAGTKQVPPPDSNTAGVADPQPPQAGAAPAGEDADVQGMHESAQRAINSFAGISGPDSPASIVESKADGASEASRASADDHSDAGTTNQAVGQAEEGYSSESGDGDGDGRQYKEPSTGQMLAGIMSSDDNLKWESKIVSKLSGAAGETMPENG